MPITPDMLADEVMQRWPETIRVFLDFRMRCIGCPIACFHTVADAAREHGIDCDRLVAALRTAHGNRDVGGHSARGDELWSVAPNRLAPRGRRAR